jgi:hypothetical protein
VSQLSAHAKNLQVSVWVNQNSGVWGYVAVCVQLYCRCYAVLHLVSLFTLHVSAYVAIFRCVGCFISIFLKESASLVLLACGYTLHVSICVFLFCFPR